MRFSGLAGYLEKLEGTSSRLEMTRILADLFSKATPEDARLVAYLTQGKLGPEFRDVDVGVGGELIFKSWDFGVADKMMLKALGGEAERLFKRLGDLGKVAEELAVKVKVKGLTVQGVFDKLLGIAKFGGEGSQEKKQQLIRELIEGLDSKSAKYVVKMILGKLRIGVSDMTVLDSLSWMITGDKSLRKDIEGMYNVRADLGEIAEELVKYKKPRRPVPIAGTPILMANAERASGAAEIWERNGECAVEDKLDGLRIQAHIFKPQATSRKSRVMLFSRGLVNVTAMFPEVVRGLGKYVDKSCVVEGEAIAVGGDGKFLPFQETAQRKRKYNIAEMAGKIPLTIYVFDVLVVEGESVMKRGNGERRRILEELVGEGRGVKLMRRRIARSVEDIEKFFDQAVAEGMEGIIAKKLDGPYQAGARDFNWIKYKKSYDKSALSDTVDAVVMGYDVGQGKRSDFGIGDFLIGIYEAKKDKYLTVAKVGTGLTDEEWRRMKKEIDEVRLEKMPETYEVRKEMKVDVWARPKIVVEIQADEITKSPMHSSGWALRFPRLVGWREKKPEEATTLSEIERLYEMQK